MTRETEGDSLTALVSSPDGELQVIMMIKITTTMMIFRDIFVTFCNSELDLIQNQHYCHLCQHHHDYYHHHHYHRDDNQVRVVMGPNCQSKIHLELLGKGHATMKMFTSIIIIVIIIITTIIIITYMITSDYYLSSSSS